MYYFKFKPETKDLEMVVPPSSQDSAVPIPSYLEERRKNCAKAEAQATQLDPRHRTFLALAQGSRLTEALQVKKGIVWGLETYAVKALAATIS